MNPPSAKRTNGAPPPAGVNAPAGFYPVMLERKTRGKRSAIVHRQLFFCTIYPDRSVRMIWPFKKKPPAIIDGRKWNDDWQVGDTAECIVDAGDWNPVVKPWHRPAKGQQFIVTGFEDSVNKDVNIRAYFLALEGWPVQLSSQCLRKVRAVKKAEETSIGQKILKAKPAPDIKRAKPKKVQV